MVGLAKVQTGGTSSSRLGRVMCAPHLTAAVRSCVSQVEAVPSVKNLPHSTPPHFYNMRCRATPRCTEPGWRLL